MPEAAEHAPDTGYYVYGVVPAAGAALGLGEELHGLDDVPVQFLEHGEVAAAVAEIALDRPPGRRKELLAHGAVVDRLAAAGPVVPVQFGSMMADREAVLQELLEAGHDRFVAILERLEGHRQLNLRASYVEDEVLAEIVRERPDIAELRRRTRELPSGAMHPDLVRLGELVTQAVEQRRVGDAEDLMDVVRPLVVSIAERTPGAMEVFDAALLVAEERVGSLEAALEDYAEAVHERIRLRLVGPVAPYDFVAEEETWA